MADGLELHDEPLDGAGSMGKDIVLSLASNVPFLSGIVRQIDLAESRQDLGVIQNQINAIFKIIAGKKGIGVGDEIRQIAKAYSSEGALGLRKEKCCLALVEYMSKSSVIGRAHDPILNNEKAIELLKASGEEDAEKAYKLAVHELETNNLITKRINAGSSYGFVSISPTDSFFYETDFLFQDWNSNRDALLAVDYVLKNKLENDSVKISSVMEAFNWSVRRMNPTLMLMEERGLVKKLSRYAGTQLYSTFFILSEEAELFWEEHKEGLSPPQN